MAAFDIMPFTSAHGGHTRVTAYPVNTGATFLVGEPVQIEAAGTIIESATLPTPVSNPPTLAGIAAVSAVSIAALHNWGSATIPATVLCPVYDFNDDVDWISNNLMTSVETVTVPALANIGDRCGLALSGATGRWGPVIGAAATTLWFQITRVLDANKRDVRQTGATGVWTVFRRVEKLQE